MHESIKKIRLQMTYSGLNYILKTMNSATRKDLFTVNRNEVGFQEKAAVIKEQANKAWQNAAIKRLIEDDIIEQDPESANQVKYRLKNEERCKLLLSDFNNMGTMLSWYLFPTEVSKPIFGPLSDSDALATSLVSDDLDSTQNDLDLHKLIQLLINNVLLIKEQQTETNIALMKFSDVFSKVGETFKLAMGAFEQVENKVNGSNKRLEAVDNTLKAQLRVFEGVQTSLKKLNESVGVVVEASNSAKNFSEQASTLGVTVAELTNEIRAKEKNKLSEIAKLLDDNTREAQGLRDILLEIASDKG